MPGTGGQGHGSHVRPSARPCGLSPLCALRLGAEGRQGPQPTPRTWTHRWPEVRWVGTEPPRPWGPQVLPERGGASEGTRGFKDSWEDRGGDLQSPQDPSSCRPRGPGKNSAESELFPLEGLKSSLTHTFL